MTLWHLSPSERRKHVIEGLDCWCSPAYLVDCDDCDGTGCWKCGWQGDDGYIDGVIELTREEADKDERTLIIVHHEVVDSSSLS